MKFTSQLHGAKYISVWSKNVALLKSSTTTTYYAQTVQPSSKTICCLFYGNDCSDPSSNIRKCNFGIICKCDVIKNGCWALIKQIKRKNFDYCEICVLPVPGIIKRWQIKFFIFRLRRLEGHARLFVRSDFEWYTRTTELNSHWRAWAKFLWKRLHQREHEPSQILLQNCEEIYVPDGRCSWKIDHNTAFSCVIPSVRLWWLEEERRLFHWFIQHSSRQECNGVLFGHQY